MSEIEITEDNCVLSGQQIGHLADIFYIAIEDQEKRGNDVTEKLLKLLEKITKLNDLAKEKSNET